MTYTVQDVINGALNRNELNDPEKVAGTPEMIAVVSRKQQGKFLVVGEVEPDFFGDSVVYSLTGSDEILTDQLSVLPAMVTRIEINEESGSGYEVGEEVRVVRTNDIDAEIPPRMIRQRYGFVGVGNDLAGVTKVKLFYSLLPESMDTTVEPNTITLLLPDQFIGTLVTELALHLAIKDNRSETEIKQLRSEVEEEEALLLRAARFGQEPARRFS